MFERKITQLFPEGLKKKEIGKYDEEQKEKATAKAFLLYQLPQLMYSLRLRGLTEKGQEELGDVRTFEPDKLTLFRDPEKKKPILTVDDILETLEVDEESLKNKTPMQIRSKDGEYLFYRYPTKDSTLSYIKEVGLRDETRVRDYFMVSHQVLLDIAAKIGKAILEEKKKGKKRKEYMVPPKGHPDYKKMQEMVDSAGPGGVLDAMRRQVDEQ